MVRIADDHRDDLQRTAARRGVRGDVRVDPVEAVVRPGDAALDRLAGVWPRRRRARAAHLGGAVRGVTLVDAVPRRTDRRRDVARVEHDRRVGDRPVLLHLPIGERAGRAGGTGPLERDLAGAEGGHEHEQRDGHHGHCDRQLDQAEAVLRAEPANRASGVRGHARSGQVPEGDVETSSSLYFLPLAVFTSVIGVPALRVNVFPPALSEPPAIAIEAEPEPTLTSLNTGSPEGKSASTLTTWRFEFTAIVAVAVLAPPATLNVGFVPLPAGELVPDVVPEDVATDGDVAAQAA